MPNLTEWDSVIPFKNNLESENPLVNIANDYMEKGYTPGDWTFSTMPSEQWKNDLGSAELLT